MQQKNHHELFYSCLDESSWSDISAGSDLQRFADVDQ